MGRLTYLELKAKEAVKKAFSRGRDALSPERLADRALSVAETNLSTVSGSRAKIAPDVYHIWLSAEDRRAVGAGLGREIEAKIRRHIEARGYLTTREARVKLLSKASLHPGEIRITVRRSRGRISLVLRLNPQGCGASHELRPGQRLTIGRAKDNDIVVDSPHVSSRHVRIEIFASGKALIADLESSNGTFLNGKKVKSSDLRDGDKLQLTREHPVIFIVSLIAGGA